MTPVDPKKTPIVHTPALHHIGLTCDNVKAAVDYLESKNRTIAGEVIFTNDGKEGAFIHPWSAYRALVELVQPASAEPGR